MSSMEHPAVAIPPGDHRAAMRDDPIAFLTRCMREHGNIVRLELDRPTWLLNDCDDVRHVLAKTPMQYHKAGFEVELTGVFGHSLINFEGKRHRDARKGFAPHFQTRAFAGMPPRIAAHVERKIATWPSGGTINLAADMMLLMLDVAADLMLGLGHEDADRIDTLFQLIRKVHQSTVARLRLPFAVPRWVPIRSNRRERRFTRKLQDVMQAIIDERDRGDLAGDDFLSLMLRWRRDDPENVSPTWLREQAMGLLLAAYEPIANATTWALTELADHPECERRVVDECCSVLSGDGPTMETYPRLEYTRMVLDETFRIHSSPWLLTRVSISEDVLPSGQTIRAGDRLFVSPYTLHRREDLYADPERFDPERFTAERRRKRKAYAYIPFGGGPRICIGEHLGRMMGVIALAVIVPRWRMRPVGPRPELESLNGFTAQPIDGRLMMCVERRDDGAGDE